MAKPLLLQNQFSSGMKRDYPRNRMPPNSAWTLKDIIIDYSAPARERGGWAHKSTSVTAVTASAQYIKGGIYAIFSPTAGAVAKNLCLDEDGRLYAFTTSGVTAITAASALRPVIQNPVFHGGAAASAATAVNTGLVIIPDGTGAAVPAKYDGTTLSLLNGSPPKAKYATVYKDYTVLANGTVGSIQYPNRVWFSPAGDPDCFGVSGVTAWDTTNSWIDFTLPVRGLASTKNALLVFGDGGIARIRGSIPPPDTDFTVDDPWQSLGLLDPFSITVHQDIIYWCAPEGIFRSDGVYLDDLTAKGGMLRYWLDMIDEMSAGCTIATGIIRNKLIISVLEPAGTTPAIIDGFMIDLQTYAWTQISNLDATSFWDGIGANAINDDTYFGRREQAFVGGLEAMFHLTTNSGTVVASTNDGDLTSVASVVETPFYELGRPGIKSVKGIHVGYSLIDSFSQNPTIAVSYTTSPESVSYTSLGSLAENTMYDRKRLQLGGRYYGLGLKFVRTNGGNFYGYDISAEVGFQEESKRKT